MEEGELEALAQTLPQDFAEHVSKDNEAFREEILRWDKRRRQEAAKQGDTATAAASSDPNNDIQVTSGFTCALFGTSSILKLNLVL